jgi:competence protein ComEA
MKRMQQILSVLGGTATIIFTLTAFALSAQQSQSASGVKQELPPGAGKDTVVRVCSGCHLLTVVTTQRKTADSWTDTAVEMRNRGANASDEELEQIVQYLATNFGPKSAPSRININTAAASEIAVVLSLPQAEAEAIVAYRDENGKFKDIAALELVPTVETTKIEAATDRIDF